jgi:hypothetical protein
MEKAKPGYKESFAAFNKLSATLPKHSIDMWQKAADKADIERGESLKIYDINLAEGVETLQILTGILLTCCIVAPTQADIRLMLTGTERNQGLKSGAITWLTMGIVIEDYQYAL